MAITMNRPLHPKQMQLRAWRRRTDRKRSTAHLVAPYLGDRRAGRVQRERLLAELDDGVSGQQHQGGVEEEAAHQGGTRLHGVHREEQQVHAHLRAPLDRHAWHSRSLVVLSRLTAMLVL